MIILHSCGVLREFRVGAKERVNNALDIYVEYFVELFGTK